MATRVFERQSPSHRGVFFRSWLKDPFHVASIAPSGKSLAKLMASGITPGARVVELGAGTGTLTDAIVDRGVDPCDLHLVEQNARFVDVLRERFPGVNVVQTDAATLTDGLHALRGTVDYVVSGLPILWFGRDKKERILREAFGLLRPEGRFQQFTYLGRSPVGGRLLAALDLRATLVGVSPLNLPPAFVYRFERRAGGDLAA
jgi:phosphatidylethanolamine/phosphatidyl-N-methylethanolamine N-methyltransferase